MKMIFAVIFGVMCINASILMLESYSTILPGSAPLTPMNTTQALGGLDVNSTISAGSTSGTLTIFNYVKEAIGLFSRLNTLVFGVANFIGELGAPAPIQVAIQGLIIFMWVIFFIELFAGRDVMD